MDAHDLRTLLEAVRAGTVPIDEAEREIRWPSPFERLGEYATIDHHRRLRCGFPEVVFGQNKTAEHIVGDPPGDEAARRGLPRHPARPRGRRHRSSRRSPRASTTRSAGPSGSVGRAPRRRSSAVVRIVTAGTSDLPVAEEARVTAEAWNCDVALVADVGVAGIHRLLGRLDELQGADVLVCVAGMEAALPSVVGGLTDCPIIGVPTSVGYGAHFDGLAVAARDAQQLLLERAWSSTSTPASTAATSPR